MEKGSDPTAKVMNSDGPPPLVPPVVVRKDRHIVAWAPEEDDLLREQISLHGTDKWYNYVNSECKKGWVVGRRGHALMRGSEDIWEQMDQNCKGGIWQNRTDNAVKNRFSTLCKKRAKHEELLKENVGSCGNTINKRIVTENGYVVAGIEKPMTPSKQIRYYASDLKENKEANERLLGQKQPNGDPLRPPLSALLQNLNVMNGSEAKHHVDSDSKAQSFSSLKTQGTFLKQDDPKLVTLLQQAEILSSLAIKLNSESTKQLEKDYDVLKRQFEVIKSENDALKSQNKKLQSEL